MRALRPGATFETERLLAPGEAVAAYLAAVDVRPRGTEKVALGAAFGRILARDAVADAAYPADDRSTMDGFAVRSADGAARRRITGTIRMGQAPPGPLGPGEAMRIPTGGVLPPGADAVLPVEDAHEDGDELVPAAAPAPRDYFTPRGDDMAAGDLVLRAGRRIGAPELSVLATLGEVAVEVYLRPRIAIVSTGDELVDAAARPGTGQVRDSNRWAIAGGLAALGCDVLHLPRAVDEVDSIRDGIAVGLRAADAVVLTGGSSVGARDHVPAAIDALGAPGVVVHGLSVKPGKPTVFAAIGTQPVIGLPGNPTSALTILDAIASHVFQALTGETGARRSTVAAVADEPFTGRSGWTWYVPAVLEGGRARPLTLRSSHTSLLARADGYVVVGPERVRIEPGEPVTLVRYGGFV
ncbi:MAG: molybdopterin molybdotransferase [Candidatus Eremiobacteraeota bacterium]|jgi:molybdenum cofactor synthesis domain-containing protein|nr:molybdopterin molybdotransferase [Candidatus Eremiobacteraeota bacterium]